MPECGGAGTLPLEDLLDAERHVWHPFTQMRAWEREEPVFIVDGEGPILRDHRGNSYFDGNSSVWVNIHGHRHPRIDAAIAAQLERIAHSTMLGLTHAPAAELARRLVEIAPPGLNRVFYSDSGSEAIEAALKMAYQYWRHRGEERRDLFVALEQGYHGDTLGAVSVGGTPLFHDVFRPLLFRAEFAPCPAKFADPDAAAAALNGVMEGRRGRIAAVVVEPLVQAAGGMQMAPPGFLRRVRQLCDDHGTLLIADEVATGFGRTGRMFACEHEGVAPDFLCLAKGLTGGYLPLAATLTTEAIYAAFLGEHADFKTFFHGHSYTGNPLACAAALASLDVFRAERVIEGLPARIAAVADALASIRSLPHVGAVRQSGLMVGIELVRHRASGEAYAWEEAMGIRVCRRARQPYRGGPGLITRPLGNVIVFMPPLCSTPDQLRAMLAILSAAIRRETECGEPA